MPRSFLGRVVFAHSPQVRTTHAPHAKPVPGGYAGQRLSAPQHTLPASLPYNVMQRPQISITGLKGGPHAAKN